MDPDFEIEAENEDDDDYFDDSDYDGIIDDGDDDSLGATPVHRRDNSEIIPEDYMLTEEFKEFCKQNETNIDINPDYGFVFFALNSKYYFPGQIVRGRIYVQLLRPIKSSQAILRIMGEEYTGFAHSRNFIRQTSGYERASAPRKQINKDQIAKERKKSVILDIPGLTGGLASNPSSSKNINELMTRPKSPNRHSKSDFINKADLDFEKWLEEKRTKGPKNAKS